ncbi:uncharacterized protein C1orf198 homolog isoform X4 [Myotis daubentonii]|uniref:uncharacterized protein C1orf198 homolog isoform X4 n=1 Tax=Myotis daubentonii TaxID=98922 RepID=UPI00287330A7|nr:uncharacterized protein C1orf198 homolog isoform X4 [Myotis daubentonii]
MASMAAAIAASRSVVMSGNRPLDERERKRFSYFASLSPMARKIMQDKERIREKYGPEWARLPPAQQDAIIDRCLVGPSAPAPRAPGDPEEPARFPGLRGPTGQKLVRFGDEEPSGGPASEPRPPSKACQAPQALRPAQGSKSSSLDALGPARKDEEAAFWKINAERSRGEGPQAEFPSLTPSQIKSMEKGEKVLPASYRPDPAPRDREAKAERPGHPRAEPLALPGAGVQPEGPPPVGACTGASEAGAPSEPVGQPLSPGAGPIDGEMADELFSEPSAAQVSASSVILKTGFDFLDNW